MVNASERQILRDILDQLESNNNSHGSVLNSEEEVALLSVALLQPYTPNDMLNVEEQEAELTRLGKVKLIAKYGYRYDTYTVQIAALRELVEILDRNQIVTANDSTHTEEQKPQEQAQKWQGYVAPKYEDTVLVAVRVEEDIRDKFHAVMRAKNTTAQEFLSDYIVQQVNKHPDLVKQGEHMDAAGTKKNYRTKLRILKEENARLRSTGHTGKSSRSR